jgi:hypothetical protein
MIEQRFFVLDEKLIERKAWRQVWIGLDRRTDPEDIIGNFIIVVPLS